MTPFNNCVKLFLSWDIIRYLEKLYIAETYKITKAVLVRQKGIVLKILDIYRLFSLDYESL